MAGTKRASTDGGVSTRSAKTAKTGDGETASKSPKKSPKTKAKGAKKGGAKSSLAPSAFKSKALPLHVNITHTPPVIASEGDVPSSSVDPGLIGAITLVPSNFTTGSYGWKGNKRISIELQNSETKEPEKVHVMITINATVMGSKDAKEEGEENGEEVATGNTDAEGDEEE